MVLKIIVVGCYIMLAFWKKKKVTKKFIKRKQKLTGIHLIYYICLCCCFEKEIINNDWNF